VASHGVFCKDFHKLPAQIKLTLIVHHPDVQLKPVTVRYGGKSGAVNEIVFNDNSWKTVELPLSADYLITSVLTSKKSRKYLVLSLDVSRTWVPQEWGMVNDPRELGVAILMSDLYKQLGYIQPLHIHNTK
jgi:hypothetical protein